MPPSPPHIVIVGGGISGLSTAFFVTEAAKQHQLDVTCTVLESGIRWGGKILTNTRSDLIIEGGPDSFLTSKPWALELCRRLGLEHQLISTNAEHNQTFSLRRGVLRELPQGLLAFRPQRIDKLLSSGLLSWWGLLRMGAERFWPKGTSGHKDESLGSFFRRRFGDEAFDYLIEPLVAGIYAGDADELSLAATFPRFRELEQQYGSIIKGMRAVQTQRKGKTPGKSSSRSPSLFMTLRNGLGELIQALVQRLTDEGVQLVKNAECGHILNPTAQGDKFRVTVKDRTMVEADAVVCTTPTYQTARLLRDGQPEIAQLLDEVPYTSTATVSMTYPSEAVAACVRGYGFVVPRKEQRPLLAGTWTSLKWPYRSQEGVTLARCYVGGRGREEILEGNDEQIVSVVRQELQVIVGLTSSPTYVEVHRWNRGMPQYVLGHCDRLDRINALLASCPNLYVSGAGLYGIGIPDCIREGQRTADLLVQSFAGE